MSQRLGEILVQDGTFAAEVVREALQHQAVFGGRLGTNLLEMGVVAEDVLAFALGQQTGAPALYGDLPPDPKALRLLDRRLADRWDVVPYLLADRRLAVLARDPRDLAMLDEVAFATGKDVHAFVVPEARLWRTLARCYGIDREHRGLDMGRRASQPKVAAPAPAPVADLMDEADFHDLYGQTGMTATPPPGTLRAVALAPGPPADPVADAPPPGVAVPVGPLLEQLGAPPLSLDVLDELSHAPVHHPPPSLARPPPLPARHSAPSVLAAPAEAEAEPTPLSFDEAVRFLEGVRDRQTIARTVLRYARTRFARAVLFTVHQAEAHGWAGLGEGLTAELVHHLRLPFGVPGVVDTVVRTRAPYVGPLPKTWANVRLLKGLGGGVPQGVLLVPVVALGRVVNVLYLDAGRGRPVDASNVGELVILAARIARSYDDLAGRAV